MSDKDQLEDNDLRAALSSIECQHGLKQMAVPSLVMLMWQLT
jgi:hypothetical protein